ncbi:MAG: CAP domain-containing protein [Ginsengibacter sp.]|jgi:uncharacterized protein YkwD
MKKILILFFAIFGSANLFAQSWTTEQLEKANTASEISYLTLEEKEAIKYLNLARLYPVQFANEEVSNYKMPEGIVQVGAFYKNSLIKHLKKMEPVVVFTFDDGLYKSAKCFAKESGESGYVGHERKICPKGNFAECASYGMHKGRDIAMQWLIDDNIPDFGHRINCLNGSYTKIGLSIYPHTIYQVCAVADMVW